MIKDKDLLKEQWKTNSQIIADTVFWKELRLFDRRRSLLIQHGIIFIMN